MAALNTLIESYVIPTGRRGFAQRGVLEKAEARGLASLVVHVKDSIAFEDETRAIEIAWNATKKQSGADPEAVPIDNEIDALIGNMVDYVGTIATGPKPVRKEAQAVLAELFPDGKAGITKLAHEEQASAVAVVLSRLGGDLKSAADALDLGTHIEELTALNGRMRALLSKPKQVQGPSWDEVRARQVEGQERLLETVARVIGAYPGRGPDDTAARAELLWPILKQNEDVRLSRRDRKQVTDVDPKTGEPVPAVDADEPVDA